MTARGRRSVVLAVAVLLGAPFSGATDPAPEPEPHRAEAVALPRGSSVLLAGQVLGAPHRFPSDDVRAVAPNAVVRWRSPLPGPVVVIDPFRPPPKKWLPGHRGVDLLGSTGSPVTAVADGVVSYSGVINGVGIVAVRHGPELRSTYQPVDDRVPTGTVVSAGDSLGVLEDGGHCLLVTCLHLGAIRGKEKYVDPMLFLNGWELSLLPID